MIVTVVNDPANCTVSHHRKSCRNTIDGISSKGVESAGNEIAFFYGAGGRGSTIDAHIEAITIEMNRTSAATGRRSIGTELI